MATEQDIIERLTELTESGKISWDMIEGKMPTAWRKFHAEYGKCTFTLNNPGSVFTNTGLKIGPNDKGRCLYEQLNKKYKSLPTRDELLKEALQCLE